MDKIEQQKIKEAKELLEKYAPKGEFLAYINEKEARILKAYGGSGNLTKETNIPSFVPWTAIAIGVSTVTSFLGSFHQARNLKRAGQWDERRRRIQGLQYSAMNFGISKEILSEQRAGYGARGVKPNMVARQRVINKLNDAQFWAAKGLDGDLHQLRIRTEMAVADNRVTRTSNLLSGLAQTAVAYEG